MPDYTSISALRPDTSGHDLLVKVKTHVSHATFFSTSIVASFPPPPTPRPASQVLDQKTVIDRPTRSGGKPTKIVECLVGDNTGTIIFSARNDQGTFPFLLFSSSVCLTHHHHHAPTLQSSS